MKKFTFLLVFSAISILSFGQWQTNGSDFYYNDNKVGIGTNEPSSELELFNDEGMYGVTSLRLREGNGVNSIWELRSVDKFNDAARIANAFSIWGGESGSEETRLVIDQNGNLGINTTNPQHKLDIDGDINITSGHNFLINGVPISSGNSLWNASSDDIYFNSGNVGIGTNSPSTLMEINGEHTVGIGMLHLNPTNYAYMRLNSGSDVDYSGIYFAQNGTNQMTLVWNPEDNAFNFQDATNSNNVRLAIEQNENVGIGTGRDALNEKLEINGNVLIKNNNALIGH